MLGEYCSRLTVEGIPRGRRSGSSSSVGGGGGDIGLRHSVLRLALQPLRLHWTMMPVGKGKHNGGSLAPAATTVPFSPMMMMDNSYCSERYRPRAMSDAGTEPSNNELG